MNEQTGEANVDLQLLLLRWSCDSRQSGHPRPSLLVQHYVGCNKEGSRAVKLLQGSPEDPQAVLVLAARLGRRHRWDDHRQHVARSSRVEDRRLGLGRHLPAQHSSWVSHSFPRTLTLLLLSLRALTFFFCIDRAQPLVDDFCVLIALWSVENTRYRKKERMHHKLHRLARYLQPRYHNWIRTSHAWSPASPS